MNLKDIKLEEELQKELKRLRIKDKMGKNYYIFLFTYILLVSLWLWYVINL